MTSVSEQSKRWVMGSLISDKVKRRQMSVQNIAYARAGAEVTLGITLNATPGIINKSLYIGNIFQY